MKACACFLLFSIFAYTISSPYNTPKEDKKGTDLEPKVVLELNAKNVFQATDETVIDDPKISQPVFRAPRVETFTDFIQRVANILKTYEDTAFTDFFDILDEEIRKYHYRGCKFYELTDNYEFRSLMAEKLYLIKRKSIPVLKADINEVVTLIRHGTYDKNVKELLEYINSLYKEDAREKFQKFLSDLKAYGNSTSERSKNYLIKIIRDGVRAIVFDHYTDLNSNVRRALNTEITTFLKKNNKAPSPCSKTNLFPYTPAVSESENTVKMNGYNIAIEDENPEHNLKIDPTSTVDNNKILILKASDETHQEEATKLETTKENNKQQLQNITYLRTDESSDKTVEGNSIELSPERQQGFNSQSYANLYTKELFWKTTEKPEIIKKSDLKSKLVQRLLVEESTSRLPPVQSTTKPRLKLMSDEDLRRSIAPPMAGEELSVEVFNRDKRKREKDLVKSNSVAIRHGTTSKEDTQAEPDKLRKTLQINSRDVSDKDLRRSIPSPMPEEELSIDVFDREERKRQKSLAISNRSTTVQHGIKDYIKRMRTLQNKVNQFKEKKINENNQTIRMNVISNGYVVKNVVDEVKQSKIKVREPKRDVIKTNSVNEDGQDIENDKETEKKYDRHAYIATRNETTKTVKSIKITVHRSLKQLPTAKNNAGNTTVNDNIIRLTKIISTITKNFGNASLNVTEEVKQKRIDNNATNDYATKDNPTRRYRRILEFSSPPLYDQPFDDLTIFWEGLHPANMTV